MQVCSHCMVISRIHSPIYSGHMVARLNETYSCNIDDEYNGMIGYSLIHLLTHSLTYLFTYLLSLVLSLTRYVDLVYSSTADEYHLDTVSRNNTKRIKFGKAMSTLIRSKLNISQVLTHSLTNSLTHSVDCLCIVL